ncbi:MAG TPA: hypothetical protein VII99_12105 [Bacteroidia bacterium]
MQIIINDHRKLFAIQKEFSKLFPYLRLEFFAKPGREHAHASKKIMKHPSKTIGECRTLHNKGFITISPNMTVAGLEENFASVYGIEARVMQKSGSMFLETASTNNWTLGKQNEQGELLAKENRTAEKEMAE